MIRINQINCKAEAQISEKLLQKKAAEALKLRPEDILSLKIVRRSINARHKPDIFYSYVLDVTVKQEEKVLKHARAKQASIVSPVTYTFPQGDFFPEGSNRPVIIGTGPQAFSAVIIWAKAGLRPILLERGKLEWIPGRRMWSNSGRKAFCCQAPTCSLGKGAQAPSLMES